MTRYKVKGRGTFPVDMLCYDCAYPANGDAAFALEKAIKEPGREQWEVELCTDLHQGPSVDRWGSFLTACEILPG